jgi:hypothetical protein
MKAIRLPERAQCPSCGKYVHVYAKAGEKRLCVHNPPNWGAEEIISARLTGQRQTCPGSRELA